MAIIITFNEKMQKSFEDNFCQSFTREFISKHNLNFADFVKCLDEEKKPIYLERREFERHIQPFVTNKEAKQVHENKEYAPPPVSSFHAQCEKELEEAGKVPEKGNLRLSEYFEYYESREKDLL